MIKKFGFKSTPVYITESRISVVGTSAEIYTVVGTCEAMCPVDEINLRIKENLVHELEKSNSLGRWKLVKSFSRSAAGRSDVRVSDLRPPRTLHLTVNYLLTQVLERVDVPFLEIYNFIFDRLRSVRQDMTIQRIIASDAITIYEKIIMFYLYSDYRLCEEPALLYDHKINSHHIGECLTSLMRLYEDMDDEGMKPDHPAPPTPLAHPMKSGWSYGRNLESSPTLFSDTIHSGETYTRCHPYNASNSRRLLNTAAENHVTRTSVPGHNSYLADRLHLWSIHEACPNAIKFRTLYLLHNMDESSVLHYYLNLPYSQRHQRLLRLSYELSLAYAEGNYVRFLRLVRSLREPLLRLVVFRHMTSLQRSALDIMNVAFGSRDSKFPLDKLASLVAFNDEDHCREVCIKMGIEISGNMVLFKKQHSSIKDTVIKRLDIINRTGEDLNFHTLLRTIVH